MEVLPHPDRTWIGVDQPRGDAVQGSSPLTSSAQAHPCSVYNLRLSSSCSDDYYVASARFTDLLLDEVEMGAGVLLDRYSRHVQEFLRENPRSRGEYALDLLVLGMVFRRYLVAAESTPGWAVELTREFQWLRRRSATLRPIADFARTVLGTLFFTPKSNQRTGTRAPSLDQLPRLIEWLSASGEFTQEAMRLNNWRSCLATLRPEESARWLAECLELFDWFAHESESALGAYTVGVSKFLAKDSVRHRCREDRILCGRDAAEYHLAMVGAEIMNRGMQSQFQRTTRRIVLVPACMRAEHAAKCGGQITGLDLTCTGCNPDCHVNRISHRMRSLGATVYLVPHSSGFRPWLARWQGKPDVGVTAVACLADILSGGYEVRSRRIAAQCVLLDYPGCQKHWSRKGVQTDLNEDRLVQIVSNKTSNSEKS